MESLQAGFSVPVAYRILFTRDVFAVDNRTVAGLMHEQGARAVNVLFVVDGGLLACRPDLDTAVPDYVNAHDDVFAPWHADRLLIAPGGEAVKNGDDTVDAILERIDHIGMDRHGYVIGLGGGAVLDASGFAASIAHRGVRNLRIPTTTLSQNDAGVGVKNGVNRFGKKNFVGTFMPPCGVINDATFLDSLEERDYRAGIAEAVKVALIKDRAFFDWIEAHAEDLLRHDTSAMERLIHRCAALHLQHICEGGDPFELGSSRPLDFGHWAAHRLEMLSHGTLRHGEAVAAGMALDVRYARHIEMLPVAAERRILDLLARFDFALDIIGPADEEAVLQGLQEFREHLGGALTIMLLRDIGQAEEVHEIDPDVMRESMRTLQETSLSA